MKLCLNTCMHTCELKHPCKYTRPWWLMEQVSQKMLRVHQSKVQDVKNDNHKPINRTVIHGGKGWEPGSADPEHQRIVKRWEWVWKSEVHGLSNQKIVPWLRWLMSRVHVDELKLVRRTAREARRSSEPFSSATHSIRYSSSPDSLETNI